MDQRIPHNTHPSSKMPVDYANGKIYCIRNSASNDDIVYVGSTAQPLSARMSQHRKTIVRHPEWKLYKLMAEVGVEHFHIELISDFPCERREQLHAEEGRHIRMHQTVTNGCNMLLTGRGKKEYYEANTEKIAAYRKAYNETNNERLKGQTKDYYVANKEKLKEQMKTYREANKEKIAAINATYYKTNKEKIEANHEAYYVANKEEITAYKKAWKVAKRLSDSQIPRGRHIYSQSTR